MPFINGIDRLNKLILGLYLQADNSASFVSVPIQVKKHSISLQHKCKNHVKIIIHYANSEEVLYALEIKLLFPPIWFICACLQRQW